MGMYEPKETVAADELEQMIRARKASQKNKGKTVENAAAAAPNAEAVYSNNADPGKASIVAEIAQLAADRAQKATAAVPGNKTAAYRPAAVAAAVPNAAQAAAENVYARYLKQLQAQESAAAAQREAQERAHRERYNASVDAVNTATDRALQQAYVKRMQQRRALPQQAAMLGSGGPTETAQTRLEAGYGTDRAELEAARTAQLGELQVQLNEGLAADTGDYYARLLEILQQRTKAEEEQLAARQEQAAQSARQNAEETDARYARILRHLDELLDTYGRESEELETAASYYLAQELPQYVYDLWRAARR